jgi:hypothetical protein
VRHLVLVRPGDRIANCDLDWIRAIRKVADIDRNLNGSCSIFALRSRPPAFPQGQPSLVCLLLPEQHP